MPTGYTADIKDGITFQQFAMSCARAFCALVTMRDEPAGAEIPESFKPSDYHLNALNAATAEMVRIQSMSARATERSAKVAYTEAEATRLKCLTDRKELQGKYEAMLAQAQAWSPPTLDHQELRSFMVTQIEESIRFDCNADYFGAPTVHLTGAQWRDQQIKNACHWIEYHSNEHAREIERAAWRTAWVQALRDSLK